MISSDNPCYMRRSTCLSTELNRGQGNHSQGDFRRNPANHSVWATTRLIQLHRPLCQGRCGAKRFGYGERNHRRATRTLIQEMSGIEVDWLWSVNVSYGKQVFHLVHERSWKHSLKGIAFCVVSFLLCCCLFVLFVCLLPFPVPLPWDLLIWFFLKTGYP